MIISLAIFYCYFGFKLVQYIPEGRLKKWAASKFISNRYSTAANLIIFTMPSFLLNAMLSFSMPENYSGLSLNVGISIQIVAVGGLSIFVHFIALIKFKGFSEL